MDTEAIFEIATNWSRESLKAKEQTQDSGANQSVDFKHKPSSKTEWKLEFH